MDNYEEYYNVGELIVKYLQDRLTDAELEELTKWRNEDPGHEKLFTRLTTERYLLEELPVYSSGDREEAFRGVLAELKESGERVVSFNYKRYIGYAASIAALLGIAYFFLPSVTVPGSAPQLSSDELLPGSNRAVLILDGGLEIDLDQAETGEIARQGHAVISKSEEGYIAYDLYSADGQRGDAAEAAKVNIISTPKGGQYRLRLPDGSRVWLNAHSSLKFPARFDREERKVELTGEAYFEVVRSENGKLPFRVVAGSQTIEVLGTEFNVNGYTDEGDVTTTLVTGRVKVDLNAGNRSLQAPEGVTLRPGQKASLKSYTGDISVSEADIEESIAWKNGYFQAKDTDLGTIMRQVARWYDVDVEYRDQVENIRFQGRFSRDLPASRVFEILKTSGVNIKREGRKIIVSIS